MTNEKAIEIDPIYFADNYSRAGCRLAVDVTSDGYGLSVTEPSGRQIETYARVRTPRALARMIEEWCNGFAPRLRDRLDQSASGSMVTE